MSGNGPAIVARPPTGAAWFGGDASTRVGRISAVVGAERILHAYGWDWPQGGTEVGYYSWRLTDGVVMRVGVQPDYRRQGIASAMRRAAVAYCREHHLPTPQPGDLTAEGEAWKPK